MLIVCLIISIVKSSLALSLGLVGALSIVRFRTPIKEPEELVYLFMAIAVGLGLGANQTKITVIAYAMILLSILAIRFKSINTEAKAVYITVEYSSEKDPEATQTKIKDTVASYCNRVEFKRSDQRGDTVSLTFLVDIDGAEAGIALTEQLKTEIPNGAVTLIDHSRIPGV